MKKLLLFAPAAALSIILIAIIGLKFFFKPIVETALEQAGFAGATVESAEYDLHSSTLKNIKLDAAGNSIAEIRIDAGIGDIRNRRAQAVHISGVKLKWPMANATAARDVTAALNLFTQFAEIKDAAITVATPLGDLPLKADGKVIDKGNVYQFDITLKGEAEFGRALGRIFGLVEKSTRHALFNATLAEGALTLPDAELLNMTGALKIDINPAKSIPAVAGTIKVGALKAFGVPMEGTSLTFQPTATTTRVVLQGNVINNSGSVLADMNVDHTDAALDKMTLTVKAELKDISALEVVEMGGAGNVVLSMTGNHVKGQSWTDLGQWKDVTGTSGLDMRKLSLPGLIKDAEALAAFKVELDPVSQQFALKASENGVTFNGKLSSLGNRPLSLDIPLNPSRPPTLRWDNKAKVMIFDFLGATASSMGFAFKKIDANLNLSFDENPSVGGTLAVGELTQLVQPPQRYFIPVSLNLNLESGKNGTGFTGFVNERNGRLSAKITGSHDGKSGKGYVSIKMPPTTFMQNVTPVSTVFPFTQYYFQDAYGTLGLSANFTWNRDAKGRWATSNNGQLYLKDFTATVNDNVISGINTVFNLESLLPPVIRNQQVAVGAVNVGLPLTEGLATVSLEQTKDKLHSNVFTLHSAEWSAAGGRIVSSPFATRLETLTAYFTLTAKQLDLQQLLNIAPLEGLTAEGKVDGTIPVRLDNGRFAIENGVLNTTAPGVIKYNPQNVPAFLQNPTQKQIIDLKAALTAFNYESLGLTINGELGKSQQVTMRIKGRNPLFYGGKPVNFNLNVEGPIENIIKYNPGNSRIPDSIRKLMEVYEASNGKK